MRQSARRRSVGERTRVAETVPPGRMCRSLGASRSTASPGEIEIVVTSRAFWICGKCSSQKAATASAVIIGLSDIERLECGEGRT